MKPLAARMGRVRASETVRIAALVAEKKRKGVDVVSFSVGEPDFDTPVHVRDAAKRALDAGHTHYVPAGGIHELREAVAKKHRNENAMKQATFEDVIVTPTKQAIAMAILAVVDDGDEVIIPDPAWVSYEPLIQLAGGKTVYVPLDREGGFRLDPAAVAAKITRKTKLIITNSPSNPTGGTDEPADVRGLADLCKDHDLYLLSDEIYEHIRYAGTHLSPASLDGMWERTMTVHGLSKSFAMTGWRMGWVVAPPALRKEIMKLQSHTITHPTSFAQYGALAALEGPQDAVKKMVEVFSRRRTVMLEGLASMPGVSCATPRGAFYAFPKVTAKGMDDAMVTEKLLEEANIAVTPGSAFGPAGAGHLRLSYATSEERIREGLARMKRWLEMQPTK